MAIGAFGCGQSDRKFGAPATAGSGGTDTAEAGSAGASGNVGGSNAGGTGGSNVGGGIGGVGPVSCTTDAECDDKLACNGTERCEASVCKAGTPPCANPDSTNCERLCTEAAAGPVCGALQGLDQDGDGHRSAACKDAPGDDCDDSQKTVYPQATEICDGMDTDCDGLADLEDGLKLSGTSRTLNAYASAGAIAWSPAAQLYGVALSAGTASTADELHYLALDPKGTTQVAPVKLTTKSIGYEVGIAWTGEDFAIAYKDGSGPMHFRRVSATGGSQEPIVMTDVLYPQEISLARATAGDFAVVWHEAYTAFDATSGQTVTANGVVSGKFPLGNPAQDIRIASSGDTLGIVWTAENDEDVKHVEFSRRSPVFVDLDTKALSTKESSDPVIAGRQDSFGIAWLEATELVFQELTSAGNIKCGPVRIPASGFVPDDIAATQRGFLLVSSRAKIEALPISNDCQLGKRFTIDDAKVPDMVSRRAHIAAGEKGFAVLWEMAVPADGSKDSVHSRVFGPNYCD